MSDAEINPPEAAFTLGDDGIYVVKVGETSVPVLKKDGTVLCSWDIKSGQKVRLYFEKALKVYRSDVGFSRRERRALFKRSQK